MENHSKSTEYLWRPNDESVRTRTKYDLEADHWYRSFQSAERKYNSNSFVNTLGVMNLILNLLFAIILFVTAGAIEMVKAFKK
ncbi:hypothetical protein NO995_09675 [Aestuariibaculum sp. M13]|uniref:hypothetical protein n=1 Tax=Aestuariibaculum sp. M13 TaxID=2967132 RepID=UPI00215A029B|nr:hypothetical protein [Aestuariibaculum sp. M13]MCR8667950.1 hypothetical protein [Aestuariibaculum sp. M13]